LAEKSQDATNARAAQYLATNPELHSSFSSSFTGEFRSIPSDLRSKLKKAFPQYAFVMAKMIVTMDFPSKEQNLILVIDSLSGDVVGHVWGLYWSIRPSSSFQRLFDGIEATSGADVVEKMATLANLMVYAVDSRYASDDRVGKVAFEKGKVQAELLRGGGVFRVLQVQVNKKLRLGPLDVRLPNGKYPRYLV
jgi:hypothetical protein